MDQQAFAQLLGNYGEFVGAVGVVVTLIFVGVQVRHSWMALQENSVIQREAASDQVLEHLARWRSLVANNPEVANLFLKGGGGESLSAEENFRYEMLCLDYIFSCWRGYDRIMATGGDQDLADEIIRINAEWASVYPGFGKTLKMLERYPAFERYYRQVAAAMSVER